MKGTGFINITISFDVSNQGIYAIYDVYIDIVIKTMTTDNPGVLPEYTVLGASPNNYFGTFHAFTVTPDNSVTIDITSYVAEFIRTGCDLEFQISFSTLYAGILVDLDVSLSNIQWTALY